jgi:acyl-coenzyme A synthetase/AMP-(fatty) acid ligase
MTAEGQLGGRWKIKPEASGGLLPGMEARTVRDGGSEADYNEAGELWLKGYFYFQDRTKASTAKP